MTYPTRPNRYIKKILVLQTFISCAVAIIFPYGTPVGDTKLTGGRSPQISLDPPFPYYGGSYQSIQLYEDGFITLNDSQVRTTYLFDREEVGFPAIVPWLAQMDAGLSQGEVIYRLTTNTTVLSEISAFSAKFVEVINFVPVYAFIATWYNVGTEYYDSSTNNKVNSFQIVMTSDGARSLVLLDYIKVEWVFVGESSYYSEYGDIDSFPMYSIKTEVSFHKGDAATHVQLPVSYKGELFDIVRDSNVNMSSVYAFKVDSTPTNLTIIENTSAVSSTSAETTTTASAVSSTSAETTTTASAVSSTSAATTITASAVSSTSAENTTTASAVSSTSAETTTTASAVSSKLAETTTTASAVSSTSAETTTTATISVISGMSTVTTTPNNLNTLVTTSAASPETISPATPSATTSNNKFNYNSSNHDEIHQSDTKLIIGLASAGTFSFLFLIFIIILCCKMKFYKKSSNGRVSPNSSSTNIRLRPSMPAHSHILVVRPE